MNKQEDFIKSYFDGFNRLCGVSKEDFTQYYNEAQYGGYPEEAGGTVWDSEGKAIYVLIRCLKPKKILEIGNYMGNSSNHILQAVELNGVGKVTLLDIQERINYQKIHNNKFTRILDNSINILSKSHDFDLIVQDGDHTYKHVAHELQLILKNNKPKTFHIWSHDYFTVKIPQCEVGRAWDEVKGSFSKFETFKDSVSNCGFCIGKK